jgi:hypothetical protein
VLQKLEHALALHVGLRPSAPSPRRRHGFESDRARLGEVCSGNPLADSGFSRIRNGAVTSKLEA